MSKGRKLFTTRRTDWVTYLTLLGVAILGLILLPSGKSRWLGGLLLGCFLLAFFLSSLATRRCLIVPVYLALQTALVMGLMALLPEKQWIFAILFFVLTLQVVKLVSAPACYVWIGVFVLATGAILLLRMGLPAGLYELLPFACGYVFLGVFVCAENEDAAQREKQRQLEDMAEQDRRLQECAAQVEALTEAQERGRLARELHDTLGHVFTTLDVQLELLKRMPLEQEEQRRHILIQAQQMVRQGLTDTRRTVHAVQPVDLERLSLVQAIDGLVANFQGTCGIPIQWQAQGNLDAVSPRVALSLYRVAQEALTNVRRHAPAADFVQIQLERRNVTLCLRVTNGPGPAVVGPCGGGRGLIGMRERIEALGGRFEAGPTPQGGFAVLAEVDEAFQS